MIDAEIPPTDAEHVADQERLLHDLLDANGEPRWVLWLDGLRYDTAVDLYTEYVSGEIRPTWNHDVGYTGDWCEEFLTGEYPDLGFFSPVPLWGYDDTDYDEREYFGVVPEPEAYADAPVKDRLGALGYLEQTGDRWTRHTAQVNEVVRNHLDAVTGGIVRYVQPHPPLDGLGEITSGRGRISRVHDAIENDDHELTRDELHDAYRRTAHAAFRGAADLIPDLTGDIVIIADHGECLYEDCCRQVFHARAHKRCHCLCVVPWIDVDENATGDG
jgi:hypothetical protein